MQEITVVAKRFLETRLEWYREGKKRGETFRDQVAQDKREGEMRALGWVLGIDVNEMNRAPDARLGFELDTPRVVTLTRVGAFDCWLVEFPSTAAVGMNTEYWAAFLTNRQLIELSGAASRAIRPWQGRVIDGPWSLGAADVIGSQLPTGA